MTARFKIGVGAAVAVGALAGIGSVDVPMAYADDGQIWVMGPTGFSTPGDGYLAAVEQLYLEPLGFTGQEIAFTTPESTDFDSSVAVGVISLVSSVALRYDLGQLGPADPLTVFGFSQSAVVASLAMPYLHALGIPSDDLQFVLVGDTASAHGGFLNTFVDSLPPELQPLATIEMYLQGMWNLIGATTPNDLYPVDVFTIQNDGWADWPTNVLADPSRTLDAINGMVINHLEYLGLTPEEIASASRVADGLAEYFTIAQPYDWLETLLTAASNIYG